MTPSSSRFWRYAALATSVIDVAFAPLQQRLDRSARSQVDVTDAYPNLFRPAGYAFAIWGVIYLAFLGSAARALAPSQRTVAAHDRLAPPLCLANALCCAWIVAYRHEQIGLSVALIVATLACGAVMYVRAQDAVARGEFGRAAAAPFSLFFGWISVATIANATIALVASGWRGGPLAPAPWAVLLLAVATALGATSALRDRDPVFSLVVAWAAVAIAVQQAGASRLVAGAAIAAAAVSAVFAALAAVKGARATRRSADGLAR